MPYDIGDKVRLTATFTNLAGTATDPSTVTFRMKLPGGTTTTYTYGSTAELVKSSTGVYYVDWTFSVAGSHYYRFAGTGTVAAADEGVLTPRRSQF